MLSLSSLSADNLHLHRHYIYRSTPIVMIVSTDGRTSILHRHFRVSLHTFIPYVGLNLQRRPHS